MVDCSFAVVGFPTDGLSQILKSVTLNNVSYSPGTVWWLDIRPLGFASGCCQLPLWLPVTICPLGHCVNFASGEVNQSIGVW